MPDRTHDFSSANGECVHAQQQPAAEMPRAGSNVHENEMSKSKNKIEVCPQLDLNIVAEEKSSNLEAHSKEASISVYSESVSTPDYSGSSSCTSSTGDSVTLWGRAYSHNDDDAADTPGFLAQGQILPSSAASAPSMNRIVSTDDALLMQTRSSSVDEGSFESALSRAQSTPCMAALKDAGDDVSADGFRRPPPLDIDLEFKWVSFDSPLSGGGAPRMCPRRLWQKDADAVNCSIVSCCAAFDWRSRRRHHCRQCGRVVCSDCSNGTVHNLSPPPPLSLASSSWDLPCWEGLR